MGNRKNQLTQKEADKIFQRLKKEARPSERLKKYVHNTLLADHHYMFQYKAGGNRFGYCSACGKNFDLEIKNKRTVTSDDETRLYAKHGEKVCCPVCGRTVTKRYAGYPHKKIYAMAGECRAEKNGALVIYTYAFSYDYHNDFRAKQEWCLEQICYFDIRKYFQLLYGYGVRAYTGDKYSTNLNFTAEQSVIDIFNYSQTALIDMCRDLKMMKDKELFRELGFDDFEQYAEQACGIKRRQAYSYIAAYEKLGESFLKENAALGITKLELISQISSYEREEFLEETDVENVSTRELKQQVDEFKNRVEQLTLDLTEKENINHELEGQIKALEAKQ